MNSVFNLLEASLGANGSTAAIVSVDLPVPAIVVSAFAIVFIAYVYIRKAIDSKKAPVQAAPVAAAAASAAPVYTGPVLTGIEEKEAAVVMAIVSDKTGIPLERLRFYSIKLMEDK